MTGRGDDTEVNPHPLHLGTGGAAVSETPTPAAAAPPRKVSHYLA